MREKSQQKFINNSHLKRDLDHDTDDTATKINNKSTANSCKIRISLKSKPHSLT